MMGRRPAARPGVWRWRTALGGSAAFLALAALGSPVLAEDDIAAPVNAVSSSGGVATAEGASSVTTGDIVTGFNTGHSVETGGAVNGDVIVTVAEMSSAADLSVIAEVGSQIADASGGDYGQSTSTPGPQGPDINVDVKNNNKDQNRNDNRSDATGIGEGGEGGAGGDGGDVIINPDEPVE